MKTNETPTHTPTPQLLNRLANEYTKDIVRNPNGKIFDHIVAMIEGNPDVVRAVNEYDDLKASESLWDSTRKANERLVYENKTLLEALKKAYKFVLESDNYNDGGEPANRLVQEVHTAIAQAEGGK